MNSEGNIYLSEDRRWNRELFSREGKECNVRCFAWETKTQLLIILLRILASAAGLKRTLTFESSRSGSYRGKRSQGLCFRSIYYIPALQAQTFFWGGGVEERELASPPAPPLDNTFPFVLGPKTSTAPGSPGRWTCCLPQRTCLIRMDSIKSGKEQGLYLVCLCVKGFQDAIRASKCNSLTLKPCFKWSSNEYHGLFWWKDTRRNHVSFFRSLP